MITDGYGRAEVMLMLDRLRKEILRGKYKQPNTVGEEMWNQATERCSGVVREFVEDMRKSNFDLGSLK